MLLLQLLQLVLRRTRRHCCFTDSDATMTKEHNMQQIKMHSCRILKSMAQPLDMR
jgi:hypothetical protein